MTHAPFDTAVFDSVPPVTTLPDAGETDRKRTLGQFFTPAPVAMLMASFFSERQGDIRILDAGAGAGALIAALIDRLCGRAHKPGNISVTAVEIDAAKLDDLKNTLEGCRRKCGLAGIRFTFTTLHGDFIEMAASWLAADLFATGRPLFDLAILNPPYRKIRSDSPDRLRLRSAGVETGNLYAGFVALVSRLLSEGGELVAITPRSFCNGPYFKSFRLDLLERMSLRRLHLFTSRSAVFSGDEVLQENIIFHSVRSAGLPSKITVSSSHGDDGGVIIEKSVPFDRIVTPHDPERFIHIPTDDEQLRLRRSMQRLSVTLEQLGLTVSTGRVVDFRARSSLRENPSDDTVPLIYPCHFDHGLVKWPRENGRKPNAIVYDETTAPLLVPSGIYVLVKRFTSKEERRRVVACVYDPCRVKARAVGFENHLNYFHAAGRGLSAPLAAGLAAFLNSSLVDGYFRQFNGHTQVNATDLRNLAFPSRETLENLGGKIKDPSIPQEEVDALVEEAIG